jgi:hypothetical protein
MNQDNNISHPIAKVASVGVAWLGGLSCGVIAQEIEQVSPGLVNETPDFEIGEDGERHLTGTSTKEVKYSALYAKACVVIQELMARVEALEAKVNP